MTTLTETKKLTSGAGFLLEAPEVDSVFTPEDFTEEHKMIAQTTEEFIRRDVLPRLEEMEHGHQEINVELLRKAAEIGLLGVEIDEEYGGLALDKASSTIVAERIGTTASFATTFGSHSGIGTLPIAYFGSESQKQNYLPQIVSAKLIAAYALTEAESGSDALAAKTTAVLSPDGKEYVLNGTKMWITNAGFADVFVVFAKIEGKEFSAFIVEKKFPGVSVGAEEKKMGIKGSSTRQVHLENARVPVENLLGEIGKGHKIALNILNMGRFKLAASCIGGAKAVIQEAVRYALERHQFGKPIASFGAIQDKLARMATYTWVGESMVYRTVGLIDRALFLKGQGRDAQLKQNREGERAAHSEEKLRSIEEYAVECSILKVRCSEYLDYVVDEAVQIFGGNGYSQEYPVERYYRDSRINRIFEGTNEINRLLIPAMILRRALRGELPFLAAAKKLQDEILSLDRAIAPAGPFGAEHALIAGMKKCALLIGGLAAQKFGDQLNDQQELLMLFSDVVMEAYAAESAIVRAQQAQKKAGPEAQRSGAAQKTAGAFADMARSYLYEAAALAEMKARDALPALADGDMLRTYQSVLKRFFRHDPINQIELRRRIAQRNLES
ncbi:MAG TPA: acyl-CoA dehydrogenase family protein [Acidobacteriota bacterium]